MYWPRIAESRVAEPFARRRREKFSRSLRFAGGALIVCVLIFCATVLPVLMQWWDNAFPAAIGSAFVALLLVSAVVMLPLDFITFIWPYFECDPDRIPHPGARFGRALYRESGQLDDWAREAGLALLSDFDSPDVTDSGKPQAWPAPRWHDTQPLLATVEYLLTRVEPGSAVQGDLQKLGEALRAAQAQGARCYLLVLTWGGGTNSMVEAIRRGEKV